MKYLDENITITIDQIQSDKAEGLYKYGVYINNELVFIGNTYLNRTQTDKTFDITDIVANYKWNPLDSYGVRGSAEINIIVKVEVRLYPDQSSEEYLSNTETVALIYRYPNRKQYIEGYIDDWEGTNYEYLLLQGHEPISHSYELTPHYPYIVTENYPLWFAVQSGNGNDDFDHDLYFEGSLSGDPIGVYIPSGKDSSICYPLSQILQNTEITNTITKYDNLTVTNRGFEVIELSQGTWFHTDDYNYFEVSHAYSLERPIAFAFDDIVETSSDYRVGVPQHFSHIYDIETGKNYSFSINVGRGSVTELVFQNFRSPLLTPCKLEISFDWCYTNSQNDEFYFRDFTIRYMYEVYTTELPKITLHRSESETETEFTTDIAYIDECPADYYLMWQDRYGSLQSQPFNKSCTFTEGIDTKEISDYQNSRKVNSKVITPKWEVNTDWLNERLYPFYESIYVSPILILYDTKEDKSYRVIVTDSEYKEKTFKNESKQLFNLSLRLEAEKKQNILY